MSGGARRLRRLVILALAATALASCGIPAEDQPRTVAREDVPFDLLAAAPDSPNPKSPEGAVTHVDVYLMAEERLVPVSREVESPVDADEVIGLLLAGASGDEEERGLSSQIPPRTKLRSTRSDDDVLTIDLSKEINTVQAEAQQRAIAQLVFTATELPGIERVRFRVEGKATPVPIGDGRLQTVPVTRQQYPELQPRS